MIHMYGLVGLNVYHLFIKYFNYNDNVKITIWYWLYYTCIHISFKRCAKFGASWYHVYSYISDTSWHLVGIKTEGINSWGLPWNPKQFGVNDVNRYQSKNKTGIALKLKKFDILANKRALAWVYQLYSSVENT